MHLGFGNRALYLWFTLSTQRKIPPKVKMRLTIRRYLFIMRVSIALQKVLPMGFEPMPLTRFELESNSLDHSDTEAK